ncbi:MAG: hypothetical protein AAGA88_09140 [Pseudomonadota bacterium]
MTFAILVSQPVYAFAQTCEDDARLAMLDVDHPIPMRQAVTTEMASTEMKSSALSTPGRRGMAFDADEVPTSLWIGGRFYTTSDAGSTWALVSEQSAEQLAEQDANRQEQAATATDFTCAYGKDLDGRTVDQFQLSYRMIPAGTPVTSTYWVDAENKFPWKVVHEFGGAVPSVITQDNTPMPELTIEDPTK